MTHAIEAGALKMRAEGEVLFIEGDIDLYEATRFREAADRHLNDVDAPFLDMRKVPFIDSAGLASLLFLARRASGMKKILRIAISGGPRRVLRITGMERLLTIED